MKLTVALPVWNSKEIAWLCLESLKRQKEVDFEWELIVFEEEHEQALGYEYFLEYMSRAGISTTYHTDPVRHTLGEKWHKIIHMADIRSEVVVFCAADNYYHPYMLRDSMRAIKDGFDWFYTVYGYFYDFESDKVIMYDARRRSGLQMAASMEIAKRIPNKPRARIVDIWLVNNMKPQTPLMDRSGNCENTLFTNGYNNISTKRYKYFSDIKYPFVKTNKKLEDIVPEDIHARIQSMR